MKWFLFLVIATVFAEDFHDANLKFTAKLYQEVVKTNAGVALVCPLSLQIILALLHAGAKGKSAEQLATTLSLPNDNAAIQTMLKTALSTFKDERYYTANIANKVFVKKDFYVKKEFVQTAVEGFKSDVENVDFTQKQQAAKTINDWVQAYTNHTIHDIISEDDIEDTLRMVLVNTLYLQVSWMNSFWEDSTVKKDFYVNKGKTVKVDMMKNDDRFDYYESKMLNAKFLKMGYRAPGMSMIVALPNDKDGLSALEERIEDVLKHDEFKERRVIVEFPKFEVDTTVELNPILKEMGIQEVFTHKADLSGISDKEHLFVSKVVQKNHIEVNEKGTIASSATAISISLDSAFIDDGPKEFVADHPFIYFIQSKAGVMFVGKYTGNQ